MLRFFTVLSLLFLTGCLAGEPANRAQIAQGLPDQSFVQNIAFEGFVNRRYIYHRPGGTVTTWEQTNDATGWRREQYVGSWSAHDGEVCYDLKDGRHCTAVNVDDGKLVSSAGELRRGDVGGTQAKNGVAVYQRPEIANAPSISEAIANNPILSGAIGAYAKAAEAVGRSGGNRIYQCEAKCGDNGGDAAGKITFGVRGTSFDDANRRGYDLAYDQCRSVGFSGLETTLLSAVVECL